MSPGSTVGEGPANTRPSGDPPSYSKRILSCLLSVLKSKLDQPHYKNYNTIMENSEELEKFMYSCVRFDILALIDGGILSNGKDTKLDS